MCNINSNALYPSDVLEFKFEVKCHSCGVRIMLSTYNYVYMYNGTFNWSFLGYLL